MRTVCKQRFLPDQKKRIMHEQHLEEHVISTRHGIPSLLLAMHVHPVQEEMY